MSTTKRAGWADALWVFTTAAVVLLHCAMLSTGAQPPGGPRLWAADLLEAGTRWSVPVLVMLAGAFLLDPKLKMTTRQWLTHVGRLALLTVVWSAVYALYDARGAHIGLEWLLEGLISLVTCRLHYHLWLLPMLLGLLLLLPLFRSMVKGASRKTLWYAALLWAVAVIGLDALFHLYPTLPGQGGGEALDLRHLCSCGGYFLFGYLLRTCEIRPKRAYILYAGGILGLAVTWWTTSPATAGDGGFPGGLYGSLTPGVCVTALAVFLLFRHLNIGKHALWGKLAPLSLGVYILHPLFRDLTVRLALPPDGWTPAAAIPLRCVVVTALSLLAAWLIRKLPKVGTLIA